MLNKLDRPAPDLRNKLGPLVANKCEQQPGSGSLRSGEGFEYRDLDRYLHYLLARMTAGLSPAACANAYFDWAIHLASSPGRQLELMGEAVHQWMRLADFARAAATTGPHAAPPPFRAVRRCQRYARQLSAKTCAKRVRPCRSHLCMLTRIAPSRSDTDSRPG